MSKRTFLLAALALALLVSGCHIWLRPAVIYTVGYCYSPPPPPPPYWWYDYWSYYYWCCPSWCFYDSWYPHHWVWVEVHYYYYDWWPDPPRRYRWTHWPGEKYYKKYRSGKYGAKAKEVEIAWAPKAKSPNPSPTEGIAPLKPERRGSTAAETARDKGRTGPAPKVRGPGEELTGSRRSRPAQEAARVKEDRNGQDVVGRKSPIGETKKRGGSHSPLVRSSPEEVAHSGRQARDERAIGEKEGAAPSRPTTPYELPKDGPRTEIRSRSLPGGRGGSDEYPYPRARHTEDWKEAPSFHSFSSPERPGRTAPERENRDLTARGSRNSETRRRR